MNEYEPRVGTWSDSQPRLLCMMVQVFYKTAVDSAMWIPVRRNGYKLGVACFQDGWTNPLREALNLQHFLLLTFDIQVPQCT